MKDFLKNVLATIVGLFVFFVVLGFIGLIGLVGAMVGESTATNVAKNSVLVIDLGSSISEKGDEENPMAMFTGQLTGSMGLANALSAIDKAKSNDNIKGIYLEAASAGSQDPAQLQELRAKLAEFKKAGKWIVAYGDSYSQAAYYVASVATKVYLNPQGELDWHGLGAQPIFVKDLMKKVGLNMQVIKVGRYKSATEMFTEDKMSDDNRAQTEAYLQGIWQNMCQEVAADRGISVAKLNEYADSMTLWMSQQELVKAKLVDKLAYADEMKLEVKKLLDIDEDKRISQVSVAQMKNVDTKTSGDEIAIYLAEGNIVDNAVTGLMMGSSQQIVAKDVCQDLERLTKDDAVKAVVIRVNSPGGSAYASEQLWHAIEKLKKAKPVVVSMGGYAASGGYYMSSGANWIVAEPTTITGSIGIYGQVMDPSQLLKEKLGIKFDEAKTNKHALFGTSSRPLNAEEIGMMSKYIKRGYELFRKRVADGRRMTIADVEKVAQGHVFTGQDALKLKLVDELGGLDKAVAKAAQLAKLSDHHTAQYPVPASMLEQLLEQTSGSSSYLDEQLKTTLGELYEPVMMIKNCQNEDFLQARMPYVLIGN